MTGYIRPCSQEKKKKKLLDRVEICVFITAYESRERVVFGALTKKKRVRERKG